MQDITLDLLFDRLETRGEGAYGLSDVSQLDHALQSAALAAERGLGDAMTIAALFHDVGHLVSEFDVDLAAEGIDDKHEYASADVLGTLFGPEISEPVRLHVAAKRYLCGADPAYYDKLSADSKRSLSLQGGPMLDEELRRFEALPFYDAALELRRIDDEAKASGLVVPNIASYRLLAEKLIKG